MFTYLKSQVAAAAVVAALLPAPALPQVRALPDFTDLVEMQGASVVNISTISERRAGAGPQAPGLGENDPFYEFFRRFIPQPPSPGQGQPPRDLESRSLGSGFVISSDGYVLTNAHVVNNADEIRVKLNDKREFKARVIGADTRTDLALLKIEAGGLQAVRFGDPSKLKVGEWVLAIGSPFGFDNTVTAGIVSAKGRSLPQENFVPFIQTDVAINPGNSGGPLFNMRGEVVGINSQIYSRTGGFMGLSFAIPIDVAMSVQSQLRVSGRVQRGRIGVVIQEVSRELAESFGLGKPAGALVNAVEKGGPAEKAGVRVGDIITRFDGKVVESSSDLPRMVGGTMPGSRASMELWRSGGTRSITVEVGELPEDRVATSRVPGRGSAPAQAANRLGLVVSDLSAQQRRELKLEGGVVIDDVRQNVRADLRRGDVILAVSSRGQTTELRSAEQFNKLLSQLDRDTTITLQIRRGESNLFVTVRGEAPRG
ncbi:MAG: DegQ family serine endoprotease [Burkholderiales bacterium]|nr:DegQ family serine endoprotease [Burkholderiales bacterium]